MNPFPARTLAAIAASAFGPPDPMQTTKDFRAVFLGSEEGVRVLGTIAHACGWLQAGAPEQLVAFAEGRRSVMAEIAKIIDRDLDRVSDVRRAPDSDY